MKSWKGLVVLLVLWAAGGYFWWTQYHQTGAVQDTSSKPVVLPKGPESWKFKSEQHWMADEIGRDIAEMVLFAKDASAPSASALNFEVTPPDQANAFQFTAKAPAGEAVLPVTLSRHFWAAENYAPWAKRLIETWKVGPASKPSEPNINLTNGLTTPVPQTLAEESKRVSKLLFQHPLDAELHEEAALILGSLALREAAGQFYDVRPLLCRMTAHLAMARALNDKPMLCGQIAEAVQSSLIGRQVEALEKIASFPKDLPAWGKALKMRATSDWRALENKTESASLLEQMEHARALVRSIDAGPLLEFLQKIKAQDLAEWRRVAMQHYSSVDEGHAFVQDSLSAEIKELGEDWEIWSGKKLLPDKVVAVLNEAPTRCVTQGSEGKPRLEVLSWGTMAAFHQRHICHSIQHTVHFLRDLWGVPDEAAAFEQQAFTLLGKLRLMPIVSRRSARPRQTNEAAMTGALDLCLNHPELLTCDNWSFFRQDKGLGDQQKRIPDPLAWFEPHLPWGTAYDLRVRNHEFNSLWPQGKGFWGEIKVMSPYDYFVIRAHAIRTGEKCTGLSYDEVSKVFAPIKDYTLMARIAIAEEVSADPKTYPIAMEKVCELDPDRYEDLSDYYLEHNRTEEAVAAYQKAIDRARDRVAIANTCDWIVNYYFDHGRKEDAVKIAEEAAKVFSHSGLETSGKLMERMNNLEAAEKNYMDIAERYGNAAELGAFYMRHQGENPKYAQSFKEISGGVFPDGMKKVTLADFSGPPRDGTIIQSTNANTHKAGLKLNDVIVAYDGYRVQNKQQYDWVRSSSTDPNVTFIAWDGTKYINVKAKLPRRLFDCEMTSYRK